MKGKLIGEVKGVFVGKDFLEAYAQVTVIAQDSAIYVCVAS
jgi:hypothetical protein